MLTILIVSETHIIHILKARSVLYKKISNKLFVQGLLIFESECLVDNLVVFSTHQIGVTSLNIQI